MSYRDTEKRKTYKREYMKDYMKNKRKEEKQNKIYKKNYDDFVIFFKNFDRVWYARHVFNFKQCLNDILKLNIQSNEQTNEINNTNEQTNEINNIEQKKSEFFCPICKCFLSRKDALKRHIETSKKHKRNSFL